MAASTWWARVFTTAPEGDVAAGGRVRASLVTLIAVILTQVGAMALFQAVQVGIPDAHHAHRVPYVAGLVYGFALTVVPLFATWGTWGFLLATLWLPVRWRKVRWVIWGVYSGLVVVAIERLVATGTPSGLVVVEICRSLVIQVMGMTALYREVIPSGRLRLVEWVMYLGLSVCVVIAGVWAIVIVG